MIEPPKITPPSADMYKQGQTPNNLNEDKSKKQSMVFSEVPKTPFDREMDQKATELKKQKAGGVSTLE
jgi:hypothetical protein